VTIPTIEGQTVYAASRNGFLAIPSATSSVIFLIALFMTWRTIQDLSRRTVTCISHARIVAAVSAAIPRVRKKDP
jgi:hypothetical protein